MSDEVKLNEDSPLHEDEVKGESNNEDFENYSESETVNEDNKASISKLERPKDVKDSSKDEVVKNEAELGEHGEASATLVPNPKDKVALFILPLALLLSVLCLVLNAPHCYEKNGGVTHYNGSNIVYTALGAVCSLILIYVMFKRRKRLED